MTVFDRLRRYAAVGLLGINRRNCEYTLRYNPRRLYPLVDDKLRTKSLAIRAGIAVPELYGVVTTMHQTRNLGAILDAHPDAAIKPSRGSGGKGILVLAGRSREYYRRHDGTLLSAGEVTYHFSNILSGMFSLGGQPDQALIEYRVRFDPVFEAISYMGVPDVRVIVFLGVPVMAMVRLPTRMSGGKANLHQGAIGAGIDIRQGRTLTAVWRSAIVAEHPDTGNRIDGVEIPQWETLLDIAARCWEMTGLGYMGVDLVLDRDKGPLILELNARPGLSIQIANRCGLRKRLRTVETDPGASGAAAARVAFARAHFGAGP